jgi:hypothetical protein
MLNAHTFVDGDVPVLLNQREHRRHRPRQSIDGGRATIGKDARQVLVFLHP